MNTLTQLLAEVPAPAAYALLAAAVLTESVLLIGTFIPTLTLLLTAGALARTGPLDLPLVITVAAAAVVAGDALAHRTGHLLGGRLRTGRLGRRIPDAAWHRATALMTTRRGPAILICRFLPVIRTLAPHLAGATAQPYRTIAPYSAAAALLWATAEASAGYAAAASIDHVIAIGGTAIAITAATAVLAALLWTALRRHARKATTSHPPRDQSAPSIPTTGLSAT
ncbi:DedA family protein [Streptomyces sp. AP-93]|uniref:DedA family protein n=1 Tax=Streptomyces sp. AP-93 TaxID=2929048 RepID=UPI001FAF4D1C|nr:VTT domain-containing protein [Streptomyces sp. AP-93]MCJ0872600.1 VTT domain-containing protein [Streptomyces sp. AP-93]